MRGTEHDALPIVLHLNGREHRVFVAPEQTLLEVLRYRMGLTGTKQGCDRGECGACTVLVDGEPRLSCLMLAATCDGLRITTIEGLSRRGQLDVVQAAFDESGALQCGFCQPGMMLAARALLNTTRTPTRDDIEAALGGNLCRCTGYTKIVDAVELAARRTSEEKAE